MHHYNGECLEFDITSTPMYSRRHCIWNTDNNWI